MHCVVCLLSLHLMFKHSPIVYCKLRKQYLWKHFIVLTICLFQPVLGYYLKDRTHVLSQPAAQSLTALGGDDLEKCLENINVHKKFFPDNRIVFNYRAYRFMKENYSIIENENTLILANVDNTNMNVTLRSPVRSLSFGVLDKIQLGDQYRIDYYGDDEDDCVCHVINHLKHVINKCQNDQVLISISLIPATVDINQLNALLPGSLGELKNDTYFNHLKEKGMWVFQTNLDILKWTSIILKKMVVS